MLGKLCDSATSLESLENNTVGCQSHGDTPLLGTENCSSDCWQHDKTHNTWVRRVLCSLVLSYLRIWCRQKQLWKPPSLSITKYELHKFSFPFLRWGAHVYWVKCCRLLSLPCKAQTPTSILFSQEGTNIQAWPNRTGDNTVKPSEIPPSTEVSFHHAFPWQLDSTIFLNYFYLF